MSYNPQVSSEPKVMRSGALTGSFDATPKSMRAQNWNQAVWFLDATLDTATDIRVRFDVNSFSTLNPTSVMEQDPTPSDPNWFAVAATDTVGTTVAAGIMDAPLTIYELVITQSGKYAFPLPLNYKWIRARAKATGAVGAAALNINVTVGMA